VTPIAAHDAAAPPPSPADTAPAPAGPDEPAATSRAARWRRLSSAVAESHRAAVPF
jgi:hypothetical protein